MQHLGLLHCFRLARCFDSWVDHSVEDVAAEEVPKEELVSRSVGRVVPSLAVGYQSYLAEDVDLDVAASGVDSAHAT